MSPVQRCLAFSAAAFGASFLFSLGASEATATTVWCGVMSFASGLIGLLTLILSGAVVDE